MATDNDTPNNRQSRGPSPYRENHPSGYGRVPNALMWDPRTKPGHMSTYAAVAGRPPDEEGWRLALNGYLKKRSKLGYAALHRHLKDLERWEYLEIHHRPGRQSRFRLLDTEEIPKEELAEEEAAHLAATPEQSGKRGGRPKKGLASHARDPLGDSGEKGLASHTRGFRKGVASHARGTLASHARDIEEERRGRDLEIAGALKPHLQGMNQTEILKRIRNLRKAVGNEEGYDALEEVLYRLQHPEKFNRPVEKPFAVAREIGESSAGRSRQPEHDLSGDAERNYHRARRVDTEQEERAARALYRDRPPLETDPEVEELQERERLVADLRRLAAEERRRAAS